VPNGHAWGWWRNHGQAPDPSTTAAPPIVDDEGDVELSPGRGEGHDHGHGHGNESGD
jgi:hypothetical protein